MANTLNRTPWIIDTASANPLKSSPKPNITLLQGCIFSGYTGGTAAQATITDDLGRTVVSLPGVSGNTPVSWFVSTSHPQRIINLTVPTLTSGQLEIVIV